MNALAQTPATLTRNLERMALKLPSGAVDFVARTLLATLFILAGYGKIGGYDANLAYMASVGVPAFMLPPTIALELLGGIALLLGFQVRLTALAFALFSVASAVLFHANISDPMQQIQFFKNLAIAGGFLVLAMAPLGGWTLDRRMVKEG